MALADEFFDPMGHIWSLKNTGNRWDIIKTRITVKEGKIVKGTPEVIAPKIASTKHSAWARLADLIELLGWDKLKSNKGKFVDDAPMSDED